MENIKREAACDSAYNPLPEADNRIAGVGIFRQQRRAGKSHPHKPLHAEYLPGSQNQTHAKGHAQLPQVNRCGQIKFTHDVVETSGFMMMPMLGKQDSSADQVAHQCHESAADQGLSQHGIAGQIDIGKAI